ncbi:hypothetical protein [Streptomyces fructofermentans]|uniref:hypothetical protein n=1 Tax=Streptomyces fructofermentans TaxID=152141 RepID=UPI0037993C14
MQEQAERQRMGPPPVWDESARSDDAEEQWKSRAFDMAPDIASALGASPLALTADTRVRGVGILAETPVPVH